MITFKELSGWLKTGIIGGWALIALFIYYFIVGFISA